MRTFPHCGIIIGLLLLQGLLLIPCQFKARRIPRGGIIEGKRRIATGLVEGGLSEIIYSWFGGRQRRGR